MGVEIERKFLVQNNDWKSQAKGLHYRQGYLSRHPERTVRVRTVEDKAYLTIKGAAGPPDRNDSTQESEIAAGDFIGGEIRNFARREYEYVIPLADAINMLTHLCEKPILEKVRYRVLHENLLWEIDEFMGENEGLVMAEVELQSEDQAIGRPPWVGKEVTGDARYYNSNLIQYPYSVWPENKAS